MITKEQALNTNIKYFLDASGHRWKRNGKCKTYRREQPFQLPIKHGLFAYGYITETNCHEFFIDERQY